LHNTNNFSFETYISITKIEVYGNNDNQSQVSLPFSRRNETKKSPTKMQDLTNLRKILQEKFYSARTATTMAAQVTNAIASFNTNSLSLRDLMVFIVG
jgi:hypothetical protein